jgi:hypothetical protein
MFIAAMNLKIRDKYVSSERSFTGQEKFHRCLRGLFGAVRAGIPASGRASSDLSGTRQTGRQA